MSIEERLADYERRRQALWDANPGTTTVLLRRAAGVFRHRCHPLAGETILEVAAGRGAWTCELSTLLAAKNAITAVTFDEGLLADARTRRLPGVRFTGIANLAREIPSGGFHYIVGEGLLGDKPFAAELLLRLYEWLQPGGQLLLFESNARHPGSLWSRQQDRARGFSEAELKELVTRGGFVQYESAPYSTAGPGTTTAAAHRATRRALLLEQAPGIRRLCRNICVQARKPPAGAPAPPRASPPIPALVGSTSVVIPCHNEEGSIGPLLAALLHIYGEYICEVIVVNDNSTDGTASAVRAIAAHHPRVKLHNRNAPAGVGAALREGYARTSGHFVLSLDADFVHIVPELESLFSIVAQGHDGAIGSRFSPDSALVRYPFAKLLANRAFHLLARLLLGLRVRDVSNNLKLYRGEILRGLNIEEMHFAANVETGLKPLLAGHDIREVPISWINRTPGMGSSSFRLLRVAPRYAMVLARLSWRLWSSRLFRPRSKAGSHDDAPTTRPMVR